MAGAFFYADLYIKKQQQSHLTAAEILCDFFIEFSTLRELFYQLSVEIITPIGKKIKYN